MHVLLITPSFPPYQGSHTERMVAMANVLVANGFEVSVLTNEVLEGNPSYNQNTMKTISDNIKIYRCAFGILHRGTYRKKSTYTSIKYNTNGEAASKSNKVRMKVKVVRFLEKAKKKLLIPDTLIDWYFPAIKYVDRAKLFEKNKPDYIISCSMPNSCHVISYKLSKKYNIPMIMDIADPWVYLSYYERNKLSFIIERFMERKYLKHSELISFSTEGCENLYIEKYPQIQGKTMTVVTGYNSDLLEQAKNAAKNNSERINLIYGGALQLGIRNPAPVLETIHSFADRGVSFHIRTDNVDQIYDIIGDRNSNILVEKYIKFEEFFKEMMESDVLVFFGNSTADQLPGKIFNYIPTGKLILYISNTDESKDQALGIVKDYGHYVIVKNNHESVQRGLEEIIRLNEEKQLNRVVDRSQVEKYSSMAQFTRFAERISKL